MMHLKQWVKDVTPWWNREKHLWKIYQKAHKWAERKNNYIASFYENKIYKRYHCMISSKAEISSPILLPHSIGIVIGAGVKIGSNVTIYQNVTIGRKDKDIYEYPSISDDVVIYSNSVLIGKIHIGKGAIIGCNSVVMRDVLDGEVVSGIVK